MKKVLFEFVLNKDEKIAVFTENEDDFIHCCYEVIIVLFIKNKEIILALDSIKYLIEIFNNLLKKVVNNKLMLHESITEDIGILDSKHSFFEKTNLVYIEGEERKFWVGISYNLWRYDFTSWLYNDSFGNIILKLTKAFPGHLYFDDETDERFDREYAKWIKNYKPFLIRTIPQKIAERWLEQTEQILEQIRQNIEQERREHEPGGKES